MFYTPTFFSRKRAAGSLPLGGPAFESRAMQAPEALLETEGLPDYEGPHSLLDALLSPGGLVGMRLRECRALATLSKHWKTLG